mmetsp:Transcript_5219/g.9947  ORF Transcript_5219/g.9947 Transcript_5219/m.9947 type:complete len:451 (+) Transcript_5219:93-1445(+)|eukprot:CAMPEP_0176499636 /NCGR_PEP_ID=MMETSP0200_2-20121128/13043_1 /TAXON_ID=947934 /ORGANISM="Chaetoceros sp., Strain GSL56" /LENGTH=450 /DNA_ID=CAMNT_0017898089 /DNA_START=56 /DNA_END=1408 /DNA_ORIENTATION=+
MLSLPSYFLVASVFMPFVWFAQQSAIVLGLAFLSSSGVLVEAGYVVPPPENRGSSTTTRNKVALSRTDTNISKEIDQNEQITQESSIKNTNIIGSSGIIARNKERLEQQMLMAQKKSPTITTSRRRLSFKVPSRELQPPFPDGLNGGRLVTLPADYYFSSSTTSTSNVFAPSIGSSFLLSPPRDIHVWLPPQYDEYPNQDIRFPVLYCHDGQNAIQDSSSWTGYSWRLAGALTRMSERKMLQTNHLHTPPIVVLLPCAQDRIAFVPRRHLEYGDISQTFAQSHADFVSFTLKPLIDSMFRTMPEKEHTAAVGSSLGGQASFHLLVRHPDIFGKAACMSPAFQPSILSAVATLPASILEDKIIYIDNGGDMDDVKVPFVDPFDHLSMNHWWNPGYWWLDSQLQPGIDAMRLALDLKGIKYDYQKFAGGRHNERAWSCRIDKPLFSLYGIKA